MNIVLVHGAWADGSSWRKVIPILKAAGHKVSATQHPLTSLQDDVEVTRRLTEAQDGATLLVDIRMVALLLQKLLVNAPTLQD